MYTGSRLSATKISTFKCCQLQYYAKYELKMRDDAGPAAWFGTAVHTVLERIVKDKKVPDIAAICKENKVTDTDGVKNLVTKTIQNGYLAKPDIIVDAEYEFDINLDKDVEIYGLIDRLDVDGEQATVIDIKTGKKHYTKKELATNYQAKMYALAVQQNFPKVKNIDVIFWFVRKQERQLLQFTLDDCKADKKDIIGIYHEIKNIKDPVPTKYKYCSYCVYNDKCPLFKPSTGNGIDLKPSF